MYRYGTRSYRNVASAPTSECIPWDGAYRSVRYSCHHQIRPGTPPWCHETWRIVMSSTQETDAQQNPRAATSALYGGAQTRRITVRDLAAAKARGEKWPMLTAYDALTARIFDDAGIPVLLVGDSAAMVVYGHDTTIPVTVDELIPLTAAVVRGSSRALVVADMPFGSYQASVQTALETGIRFLKETGAQAVKLEGGQRVVRCVEELVAAGVPVMGHLGLTPQSVNA